MGELKQSQKAGDNSVQNQIGTQIVVGIDEKRVREICDEKIALAINDYSFEGQAIARQRIDVLTEKIIERLRTDPSKVQAFSDPSFQRDVVRTQIAAAESDRKADVETLAELLFARMNGKLKRATKTGIRKAIEVVPELEENELTALAAMFFYSRCHVNNIYAMIAGQYFAALDANFSAILSASNLPQGAKWLQHLNILDCVEVNYAGSFKKTEDYYAEDANGIVCVGIANNSAGHIEAAKILNECGVGESLLMPNELLPEYVRLPLSNLDNLSMLPVVIPNVPKIFTMTPTEKHKDGLRKVINLYSKDSALLQKVKTTVAEKMSEYASLKQFKMWLSSLNHSFELTPIGEALAYVNARRCIPGLPVMELE